ncbi:MAG: DEAD/DEAH box helicase, partial [Synechococcaceae cyanobacterium]
MTSSRAATPAGPPAGGGFELPTVPPLAEIFPFALDGFQLEAIDALNQGHSVVVSAPTGSGKTLVGEYAIHRALAHGRKVFYT